MHTDTNPLVDSKTGLVSRRIFIEPEIYREELERIFAALLRSAMTTARNSPTPESRSGCAAATRCAWR